MELFYIHYFSLLYIPDWLPNKSPQVFFTTGWDVFAALARGAMGLAGLDASCLPNSHIRQLKVLVQLERGNIHTYIWKGMEKWSQQLNLMDLQLLT